MGEMRVTEISYLGPTASFFYNSEGIRASGKKSIWFFYAQPPLHYLPDNFMAFSTFLPTFFIRWWECRTIFFASDELSHILQSAKKRRLFKIHKIMDILFPGQLHRVLKKEGIKMWLYQQSEDN